MQRGSNIPEAGKYSEVVVKLTGLCVKNLNVSIPFWLRAIIPYLSIWMDEQGDICKPSLAVR